MAAFDVVTVDDADAARAAIEDREVYGAVVVSPDGQQLLVASGAGPAVAQLLRSAATELSPAGATVPVEDVVPTDPDDPIGAGLGAAMLPLVMTSVAGGIIAGFVLQEHPKPARGSDRHRHRRRSGIRGSAAVRWGSSMVPTWKSLASSRCSSEPCRPRWLDSSHCSAGPVIGVLDDLRRQSAVGCCRCVGDAAAALGAIGQLLPPGAGVSATRSVAFFDGAASAQPLTVLAIWLLAGLALLVVGGLRHEQPAGQASEGARQVPASV